MAAMLNYRQAEQLARAWVDICGGGQWDLMREYTLSKPYGWVFFYQSRQYVQTRDDAHRLCGNAPIIIDRYDGEIRITGTAHPIEHYLMMYEASLPPARLQMTPEQPPA
jgi:hypothetical protein